MSHILGYVCSDRSVTQQLFKDMQPQLELHSPSDSSGVGLGWMQDDRSLLRNHPKPSPGLSPFLSLAADVPSRTVVGHVRAPGLSAVSGADLAPFRFKKWLWVSADVQVFQGTPIPLPDHIKQNLHGRSESEWLFHVVMREFAKADVLEPSDADHQTIVDAVRSAFRVAAEHGITSTAPAILATNKWMLGLRREDPLLYRVVSGYEIYDEPAFAGHKPKPRNFPTFRAALLTNATASSPDWVEVPVDHAIAFDNNANPEVFDLSL